MRRINVLALLLVLAVAIGANATLQVVHPFDTYIRKFGKQYSAKEYAMRLKIFQRRLAELNEFKASGKHFFSRGVNEMTDWTDAEIAALNGARPHMARATRAASPLRRSHTVTSQPLPHQVDYRFRVPPVLTAIKNQGYCGSCWAHSSVEAMESHWAIATGKLHVLSQQQVTACTPNPRHCGGTGGCEGSVESLAFAYIADAGGINEEWAYPYTAFYGKTGSCQNMSVGTVAKVSGFAEVPANDQAALMDAVAFVGPIAVSVDASYWSSYTGGIFDGCSYAKNITQNHAVQLVGYGYDDESGKDYWLIRNSWGPLWGEDGYIRLLRESTPQCGWNVNTHEGSACDGDPDQEWVCGMCGILSGSTYPIMDTA